MHYQFEKYDLYRLIQTFFTPISDYTAQTVLLVEIDSQNIIYLDFKL
jgi:hypothetical protein